MIYLTNY